jgi:calcium permeable stress-gated cation channel
VNLVHGRGANFALGIYGSNDTLYTNVTGLDQLAWGNVHPRKNNRYWAHLILAVLVVGYTCYIFFDELRGYVRLRQAYLTSPQHRLRASATTVLVTGIPPKWCTFEALNGLYDVFPGGIRNIWVNRNYDELNEKVKLRSKVADRLEGAETNLIKNARKAYLEQLKAENKRSGKETSKEKNISPQKATEDEGLAMANSAGVSSGNPHQAHTLDEELAESGRSSHDQVPEPRRPVIPIPILGQGIEAVGHGIDNIGRTVIRGLKQVGKDVDERFNNTPGLILEAKDQTDGANDVPHGAERGHSIHNKHESRRDRDRQAKDASNDFTIHQSSAHSPLPPGSPSDFGLDGGSVNPPIDGRLAKSEIDQHFQQDAESNKPKRPGFKFWNHERLGIPSPTPHRKEDDEFPLSTLSPITPGSNPQAVVNSKDSKTSTNVEKSNSKKAIISKMGKKPKQVTEYPVAYNIEYDLADEGEPAWKTYLKDKDRDTMRLPIYGWQWMPSLPFVGKKVDTIDYCRKELARLNVEIEQDQGEPERFPLMNSAFVQFNHQVAAHMACQAVSHHTPNQMAPRMVEISPDDVLWDNMSIKWWESYIRTAVVLVLITGLIIGWAFPVTFTGLLSQIQYLQNYKHLTWLKNIPDGVKSIIQGILPPLLLTLLLGLLPVILRVLARSEGSPTGMSVELTVQNYYFAFLFVQVFLVVSISSGITTVLDQISQGPQNIPSILAGNLPKASNYFFSYMILQAFSVSAAALVQLLALFKWFVLAPLLDNTARKKWSRQTNLPDMRWGTFFPVYTNLAAIGEWILRPKKHY